MIALILAILVLVLVLEAICRLFVPGSGGMIVLVLLLALGLSIINSRAVIAAVAGQEVSKAVFIEGFKNGINSVVLPLIAASLVFSLIEILISRSISKKFSIVFHLARPVALLGFFFVAYRQLSTLSLEIFGSLT